MVGRRKFWRLGIKGCICIFVLFTLFTLYNMHSRINADNTHKRKIKPNYGSGKSLHFRKKDTHFWPMKDSEETNSKALEDLMSKNRNIPIIKHVNNETLTQIAIFLEKLYPFDWAKATPADEMTLDMKQFLLEKKIYSDFSCKHIDSLKLQQIYPSTNGRKYIDVGKIDDVMVAVKSQKQDHNVKIECMQNFYDPDFCSNMSNYKIMRELIMFILFKDQSIAKMLGFCIRGDEMNSDMRKKGITMVMEFGNPETSYQFGSKPWLNKLEAAIQLTDLLLYMENSPLRSVGFGNIRTEDFITVGRDFKLSDLGNLKVEEPQCRTNSDCVLSSYQLKEVECNAGSCDGYNAMSNLNKLSKMFFEAMLQVAPSALFVHAERILFNLRSMNITSSILKQSFIALMNRYAPSDEIEHRHDKRLRKNGPKLQEPVKLNFYEKSNQDTKSDEETEKQQEPLIRRAAHSAYMRYDHASFLHQFDFPCINSRNTWRCALTVGSLSEAMSLCDLEPMCEAFVVASADPDSQQSLDIILKNSSDTMPLDSPNSTLFIRVAAKKTTKPAPKNTSESSALCLLHNLKAHHDARIAREKKLLAHMGLKGITEEYWMDAVDERQIIKGSIGAPEANMQSVGKKFNFEFLNRKDQKAIKKATFLAGGTAVIPFEYLIVHRIDRMLGLHHVPPTSSHFLTESEVKAIEGSDKMHQAFTLALTSNGQIGGIMTLNRPNVFQPTELLIAPEMSMVTKIVKFTKSQKAQLEYILVAFLAKIANPTGIHYAYKGHFVHFDRSLAFTESSKVALKYFNNCQFPNIAYKSLTCFHCQAGTKKPSSTACSFGHQVMKSVKEEGIAMNQIQCGTKDAAVISSSIDQAASLVHSIIENCIKTFGREAVVY